jgi:hypothetical protein
MAEIDWAAACAIIAPKSTEGQHPRAEEVSLRFLFILLKAF